MMLYIDIANSSTISYLEFFNKLNARNCINKYVHSNSLIEIWIDILLAIYHQKQVYILDSDLSGDEIQSLGIREDDYSKKYRVPHITINGIEEIAAQVSHRDSPVLNIYTSGTTGQPKSIAYSWSSITRSIKIGPKYSFSTWALAYNPTHFAGLQVFFQAITNACTLINVFNIDSNQVAKVINEHNVISISATPTFYRNLISRGEVMSQVNNVSIGGEKSDKELIDKLSGIFPKARIRNIYASTEGGSLFTSKGEVFKIPVHLQGKVNISEQNELLLHMSLLGEFSGSNEKEWYETGDIIRMKGKDSFVIVSRKNEMLNVGGYKVNPHEIEKEINTVVGVVDCRVYSKPSKILGSVVVADIISDNTLADNYLEKSILENLSQKLQKFKIPRVFYFVDSIKQTRTGKKSRI